MPKMTHPRSAHAIDVAPDQVPMYESQGWRTGAAAKKRAPRAPRSRARKTAKTANENKE